MSTKRRTGGAPGRAAALLGLLLAGWLPHAAAAPQIRIEIDGVDRAVADNVRGYLTLTRYVEREDVTDAQVRRLADRAVDEAADALRPYGYYDARIRSRTTRDDGRWIVRLRIDLGDPVRMDTVDVRIEGPGKDEAQIAAIPASSSLQPGARLDHTAYENLKTDLLRQALDLGYLDGKLTRHELVVDPAARKAEAHLTLETGGRYRFGEIKIEQDAISPQLLQRYVRFSTGQPFASQRIRSTQYALEDSYYFSEVSILPGDRDPETLTVPVTIRATPSKRDRYIVSLGYGTDTSVRGRFAWENRRVNQLGHRWRFDVTASSIRQDAIFRYLIPIGDPALEKLEFTTGYVNEKRGDLDSERYQITASITQTAGRWQRVLFLWLNDERTGFPDGTSNEDLLLIPGISYASMPPNFLTGWVRDAAYFVELSGSPQTLGSDASYLQLYGRAEKVWPIGGPWYLRLRGELGTSWVNEFSQLPASQRFFAGGDRSVRGFAYDELSPREPPEPGAPPGSGKAIGGEHKLVGSVEIERDLPRNFRVAAFYDTGNAFDSWDTPLEYSVGIGVRWKLPMMLIGLDVAQALSEPGKNPRLHLNITQVL